jgi:hypothetical protein
LGSLFYLCGLMNSRLLDFYLKQVSTTFHGGYFGANKQYIDQLPICQIDPDDHKAVALQNRMAELVRQMLSLKKDVVILKTPHELESMQRRIDALDNEIDRIVYALYGLSTAEISCVEGPR